MHSDGKKRRDFRFATATPLLAAGDLRRYALEENLFTEGVRHAK